MTEKEKELVDKYLAFKKAEEEAHEAGKKVLNELSLLAPHQKGEIIKWTKKKRKVVSGSFWNPVYSDPFPKENTAVLTHVEASVLQWSNGNISFDYKYEFRPIKKDGKLSANSCYPHEDFVWTGEKYKQEEK